MNNPQFFKNHPDLKWILTTGSNAANVPGVIKVGPWNMPVGLLDLSIGNGTYQTISKVHAGNLYYYKAGDGSESTTSKEIYTLACSPCTNLGSGPFCCKNNSTSKILQFTDTRNYQTLP